MTTEVKKKGRVSGHRIFQGITTEFVYKNGSPA
jgi:hypothetical protein